MRQTLLAAAAAFVIGGIAAGAVLSQAQPAPPQPPGMAGPPPHHAMMGWGPGMRHHPLFNPRDFALVFRQDDRQLAPADVQKIAEAFLLLHGNHSWKVANVAPDATGAIAFSLTTADGSVVARFTMDPHSGRIHRVG